MIRLPINPELGVPEHQEARWVSVEKALTLVTARLKPVVRWSYNTITHGLKAADKPGDDQFS